MRGTSHIYVWAYIRIRPFMVGGATQRRNDSTERRGNPIRAFDDNPFLYINHGTISRAAPPLLSGSGIDCLKRRFWVKGFMYDALLD